MKNSNDIINRILKIIKVADKNRFMEIIIDFYNKNGIVETINNVIEPVFLQLGIGWEKEGNTASFAEAYVAVRFTDYFLKNIVEKKESKSEIFKKGKIVIGNIENDFHSTGKKLVTSFLEINGWNIIDLGIDIKPKEFIENAIIHDSDIIGVSAMALTTAVKVRTIYEELEKRKLHKKIKLAVGGAIFSVKPKLAYELGADGTAKNAVLAPKLMRDLKSSN